MIFGDGAQTIDFVSVHDVVDMALLVMEKEEAIGKVFNVGTLTFKRFHIFQVLRPQNLVGFFELY